MITVGLDLRHARVSWQSYLKEINKEKKTSHGLHVQCSYIILRFLLQRDGYKVRKTEAFFLFISVYSNILGRSDVFSD